mmetsp:Transcript_70649/g.143027  ORF Transcript_70649/g.143027 Transcript_70649/m.143027 type:complete len:247 (-) Transcript_70649:55-795(-)
MLVISPGHSTKVVKNTTAADDAYAHTLPLSSEKWAHEPRSSGGSPRSTSVISGAHTRCRPADAALLVVRDVLRRWKALLMWYSVYRVLDSQMRPMAAMALKAAPTAKKTRPLTLGSVTVALVAMRPRAPSTPVAPRPTSTAWVHTGGSCAANDRTLEMVTCAAKPLRAMRTRLMIMLMSFASERLLDTSGMASSSTVCASNAENNRATADTFSPCRIMTTAIGSWGTMYAAADQYSKLSPGYRKSK